jgi:hypothetical protein
MAEFYDIGMSCRNCGKPLQARERPNRKGYSIKGLRDLEYVHTDGTTECVIVRTPYAFDEWRATAAFEKARKEAWDREDELATTPGPASEGV